MLTHSFDGITPSWHIKANAKLKYNMRPVRDACQTGQDAPKSHWKRSAFATLESGENTPLCLSSFYSLVCVLECSLAFSASGAVSSSFLRWFICCTWISTPPKVLRFLFYFRRLDLARFSNIARKATWICAPGFSARLECCWAGTSEA